MDIPSEIWWEILEFHDELNIRQVCKLFNNIVITMFSKIDNLTIYSDPSEYYIFDTKKRKIKVSNLEILIYFTNVKNLKITNLFYYNTNINDFIRKYVSVDIKELNIKYESTDIDWKIFTRFKELTHLYIDGSMFYKKYYLYVSEEDSDEYEYEYIDGSLNQSIGKLVKLLEHTKLYYLRMSDYNEDCHDECDIVGPDHVVIIKDKVPNNWDEEYSLLKNEFEYELDHLVIKDQVSTNWDYEYSSSEDEFEYEPDNFELI